MKRLCHFTQAIAELLYVRDVLNPTHRYPCQIHLDQGFLDRALAPEALWGTRVSPSTVSDLNKKIYGTIEAWRNRPIEGEHPYVYMDGIVLKRSWAGEVRNVSLLVAIGVNGEGYREILGICEGAKEDKAGWSAFLQHLKGRGLHGVRLIISDGRCGPLLPHHVGLAPTTRCRSPGALRSCLIRSAADSAIGVLRTSTRGCRRRRRHHHRRRLLHRSPPTRIRKKEIVDVGLRPQRRPGGFACLQRDRREDLGHDHVTGKCGASA